MKEKTKIRIESKFHCHDFALSIFFYISFNLYGMQPKLQVRRINQSAKTQNLNNNS